MIWLAAAFILGWEFPREYTPVPEAFVISYASVNYPALAQMSVPPSKPTACQAVPSPVTDTFCAQWPQCPEPGVWVFLVHAHWADADSDKAKFTCLFKSDKPCLCQDVPVGSDEDKQAQALVGLIANPDTAQKLTDELAKMEKSPQPDLTMPPLPTFLPQLPTTAPL